MTDQAATQVLWAYFWEWYPAPWNETEEIPYFRRDNGQLVRSHLATMAELEARRNQLIGRDHRFKTPELTKGARFI